MRSLFAFVLAAALALHARAEDSASEFRRLLDVVRPSESERAWESAGWKTDLWDAVGEASRAGKPVFLWEMDGHPLGCT